MNPVEVTQELVLSEMDKLNDFTRYVWNEEKIRISIHS